MRNHLIVCCQQFCRAMEMVGVLDTVGEGAKVVYKDKKIVLGEDQYLFILDNVDSLEQIKGMSFSTWKRCEHSHKIIPAVKAYIQSHPQ